ncbi:amino acid ABC transporter ATP-binding protein [Gluconobacter sphaericus]|uniref:amino acid ABC transporter ATP-binding protein n=1 Tax=Gluconobacter sphaericus TaxID=574987 RepID=UPI001B8B9A9C|nr:ATP-binding cassette domain-containing protein [Gluconobacter sphaericus]MBS1097663.1 amino acid ABC transporter ATP-binding protein [Gluconobacter sphaericus]
MPYIDVRDVCVRHGKNEILRHAGFEAERGEIVSFIGPSGSGKTTFLRTLIGLQSVWQGRMGVDGRIVDMAVPASARILREQAAIVFQQYGLFGHMSVLRNLTLAPTVVAKRSRREAEHEARALLERLGLADKADVLPADLSGGQKQRVAIARALMLRPSLLLLDEPTSALDPHKVRDVGVLLRDLAQDGMTIIQVSHAMVVVSSLSDRIVLLEDGQVSAVGTGRGDAAQQPDIAAFMNTHGGEAATDPTGSRSDPEH